MLSVRGIACCRRHPARSTDRVSGVLGLDANLDSAGVTKGALYYHFDSKEALGYAIVEEVIAPDLRGKWVGPLTERQVTLSTL